MKKQEKLTNCCLLIDCRRTVCKNYRLFPPPFQLFLFTSYRGNRRRPKCSEYKYLQILMNIKDTVIISTNHSPKT